MSSYKSTRIYKGKSLIDFPDNFVVIDIETTGTSCIRDSMIELAAIKVSNGIVIDTFQELINPHFEISPKITMLTGITNAMLKDARSIEQVFPDFYNYIGENSILVGHNINSFDMCFIYDKRMELEGKPASNNMIDTLKLSRSILPELSSHKLEDLINYFNINTTARHRALADCFSTYELLKKLKQSVIERNGSVENYLNNTSKKKQKKTGNSKSVDLKEITATTKTIDINNPLYKKQVCFTGTLERYTRPQAAQIVVNRGGTCHESVNQKTDILVWAGNDDSYKSGKVKKAEELIAKGFKIKIISEQVFYEMIETFVKIRQTIQPKSSFTTFYSDEEKIEFLKEIGLLSKTAEEIKPFFYIGAYSDEYVLCDVVGFETKSTLVIELGEKLHCINTDCFIEMQPLAKDIYLYSQNLPDIQIENKCSYNDEDIMELLNNSISKDYLKSSKLVLKINKGSYNSIIIEAQESIYRVGYNLSIMFARLKTEGKVTFISFSDTYKKYINGIFNYTTIKSDESFLRISIDEFFEKVQNKKEAQEALNKIFVSAFTFEPFGCCGRYKECSEKEKCVHPDLIYASVCQYKKNLDKGNAFYKKEN